MLKLLVGEIMKTPKTSERENFRKALIKDIEDAKFLVAENEAQLRIARDVLFAAEYRLREFEQR